MKTLTQRYSDNPLPKCSCGGVEVHVDSCKWVVMANEYGIPVQDLQHLQRFFKKPTIISLISLARMGQSQYKSILQTLYRLEALEKNLGKSSTNGIEFSLKTNTATYETNKKINRQEPLT